MLEADCYRGSIFIETTRGRIEFDFDKYEYTSIFDLPLWSSFQSNFSHPDFKGSKVQLALMGAHEHEDLEYSWEHLPCYVDCVRWFLHNEREVLESAISAITVLIDEEIRPQYRELPKELGLYLDEDLDKMINLIAINFYPESKDDLPYFGLQFSCEWDPEHGCGLMFHGTNVVVAGQAEVAISYIDFEQHGAYIEL